MTKLLTINRNFGYTLGLVGYLPFLLWVFFSNRLEPVMRGNILIPAYFGFVVGLLSLSSLNIRQLRRPGISTLAGSMGVLSLVITILGLVSTDNIQVDTGFVISLAALVISSILCSEYDGTFLRWIFISAFVMTVCFVLEHSGVTYTALVGIVALGAVYAMSWLTKLLKT